MAYIGSTGERITLTAEVTGEHHYETHYAYKTTTMTVYTLKTEAGDELVWKTARYLEIPVEDEHGWWSKNGKRYRYDYARKGDVVSITGTVKAHSEYNDREQTELQRVKLNGILDHHETWEDRQKAKQEALEAQAEALLASIGEGDQLLRMAYGRYKEHYADCETIPNSYDIDRRGNKTIQVIVRAGRMVNSGVRDKKFKGWLLENDKGERMTFKAVSIENALKQASKVDPDTVWKSVF